MRPMTLPPRSLAAALLLASAGAGAQGPAKPTAPAAATPLPSAKPAERERPRASVLEEVSGVVIGLDRKAHRLTMETTSGPATLTLDRNTMIYTVRGLGTVLDVRPGDLIRVGRNADSLAYWIQIRPQDGNSTPRPSP